MFAGLLEAATTKAAELRAAAEAAAVGDNNISSSVAEKWTEVKAAAASAASTAAADATAVASLTANKLAEVKATATAAAAESLAEPSALLRRTVRFRIRIRRSCARVSACRWLSIQSLRAFPILDARLHRFSSSLRSLVNLLLL